MIEWTKLKYVVLATPGIEFKLPNYEAVREQDRWAFKIFIDGNGQCYVAYLMVDLSENQIATHITTMNMTIYMNDGWLYLPLDYCLEYSKNPDMQFQLRQIKEFSRKFTVTDPHIIPLKDNMN